MNRSAGATSWTTPMHSAQFRATVVLLLSTVLMLTWKYFAAPEYLKERLPSAWVLWDDRAATAAIGSFLGGFVLLGLVPALVVKFVFRERLADYGVRLGDPVRTARTLVIFVPCCVLAGAVAAADPEIQAHYPINPNAGASPAMFLLHAAAYLLMYVGWEFHFRGFVQCGLRPTAGVVNAVLVQVLASSLLHIGKPAAETFAAILGGILWGILAVRTRSLLSGLGQHYALGLSLDWFLCRYAGRL